MKVHCSWMPEGECINFKLPVQAMKWFDALRKSNPERRFSYTISNDEMFVDMK